MQKIDLSEYSKTPLEGKDREESSWKKDLCTSKSNYVKYTEDGRTDREDIDGGGRGRGRIEEMKSPPENGPF